jgi:hypothetical protein
MEISKTKLWKKSSKMSRSQKTKHEKPFQSEGD